MSKDFEEGIVRYTSMVVIYSTDMAYNYIKALEPLIVNQDKETKRIYGALRKRYKRFFHYANEIYKEDVGFIADYSSIIDDKIDPIIEEFTKFVNESLLSSNVVNSELIAKTEMARVLTHFSVVCVDCMEQVMKESKIPTGVSNVFKMNESASALDDLYSWVTRKITTNININENGEVQEFLKKLQNNVMAFDTFAKAYNEASQID